jgi:hypothetical protein
MNGICDAIGSVDGKGGGNGDGDDDGHREQPLGFGVAE